MTRLSRTQALVRSAATQGPDRVAVPLPESLRGGAAAKVVGAMITKRVLQEDDADLPNRLLKQQPDRLPAGKLIPVPGKGLPPQAGSGNATRVFPARGHRRHKDPCGPYNGRPKGSVWRGGSDDGPATMRKARAGARGSRLPFKHPMRLAICQQPAIDGSGALRSGQCRAGLAGHRPDGQRHKTQRSDRKVHRLLRDAVRRLHEDRHR